MTVYRLSQLRRESEPYVEFLRSEDLSAGLYRLKAGAADKQNPHSEEEVYYVVSGRARFTAGEDESEVRTGDILFVPAQEPHRFHDIEEDLEVLVFFAPAEGSRR